MLLFALALLAADATERTDATLAHTRVLVTDAKGGAPRDVKGVVTRELATALTRYPALEVLAYSDLRRMMELESARQLTACDDAKMQACLADLQSALGVPWAVFVDVDEVGAQTNIGLTLVASDSTALSRQSVNVADLTTLQTTLAPAVRALVTPLHAAIGAPLPADPSAVVDAGPGAVPFVVAGAGAVVAVASAVAVVVGAQPFFVHDAARAELLRLRAAAADDPAATSSLLDDADAQQRRQAQAADDWQSWGQAVVVVGAVGVVAGVAAASAGLVWGLE